MVATDWTHIGVADIMAHRAIAYIMLQPNDSLPEGIDTLYVLPQQVERQA